MSDLPSLERDGRHTKRERLAFAIERDILDIARDSASTVADADEAAIKPLLMDTLFSSATKVVDIPGFLLCCYLPGAPTAETIKSVLAHLEMEGQDVTALTEFDELIDKRDDRKRDAQACRNHQRDVNCIVRRIVDAMAGEAMTDQPGSIQEVLRDFVFGDTGSVRRDTGAIVLANSLTRGQAARWAARLKVLQSVVRHFQIKYPLWTAWHDANGEAPSPRPSPPPPAQQAEPTLLTRKRKKPAVVSTQTATTPADVIDLTSWSDDAVLSPPALPRKVHRYCADVVPQVEVHLLLENLGQDAGDDIAVVDVAFKCQRSFVYQ
ncbi:hypothetical protein SDRG_10519 [Saprolegnia diclina VS20]|uniref:Uncharacterized protein n=1 Tax=Saprolegnia diclina (strain VS20) TaxID=1156394 RepID=T0RHD8_SAPDV|nr:hypothetical protein SDRG_10519 [Saprolegnia diclina VS20]EQC31728.1 hypothetical protein SDRG_10519 [Saprolegnia diclina VS20]|eukprot:XP_008614735.1 hypothetical protein SDRG_10519 [Saprolegnia diclina VS20]